jgi:hypothetical protein
MLLVATSRISFSILKYQSYLETHLFQMLAAPLLKLTGFDNMNLSVFGIFTQLKHLKF